MFTLLQRVIEISKKYLPTLSVGYQSPKLTLHIGDGFKFMKEHQGEFDVIITDSSDPVGKCSQGTRQLLGHWPEVSHICCQ